MAKMKKEVAEECSARRAAAEEERKKVRRRPTETGDDAALNAFAWFDRQRGREIACARAMPRQLLLQVLLCTNTELAEWEAWDLLTGCGSGSHVRYEALCRTRGLELAWKPPPPPPPAEKEEAKEETKAAAEGAGGAGAGGDAAGADMEGSQDKAAEGVRPDADAVAKMAYKDLQQACKDAGLKASGKAEELRERLLAK